jgi:hypothetical protein
MQSFARLVSALAGIVAFYLTLRHLGVVQIRVSVKRRSKDDK